MINKIQLNDTQVQLAKGWLPPGSYPYAYDNIKGTIWFWQTWNNGLPIKGSTKLTQDQLRQLDQLR